MIKYQISINFKKYYWGFTDELLKEYKLLLGFTNGLPTTISLVKSTIINEKEVGQA